MGTEASHVIDVYLVTMNVSGYFCLLTDLAGMPSSAWSSAISLPWKREVRTSNSFLPFCNSLRTFSHPGEYIRVSSSNYSSFYALIHTFPFGLCRNNNNNNNYIQGSPTKMHLIDYTAYVTTSLSVETGETKPAIPTRRCRIGSSG